MAHVTPCFPVRFYTFLPAFFFFLLFTTSAFTQSTSGLQQFFAARHYDNFEGAARIALVRTLEKNGWYEVDSIYEWRDAEDKTPFRTIQRDLSPFVNGQGHVVYWVPDVAPQFPGGRLAGQQYMRDVVGPMVSGPDDEVQNSVYVRCTIGPDGSIGEVAEAQPHAPWVPVEIIAQCLDAVRYMPAWSPGVFREKAVRVCVLVEVGLKE